jgi:hypothetical protein
LERLIPRGIAFFGNGPEGREYRQLQRDYANLLAGVPPIDGWRITERPHDLDEIAQWRLDAAEVGELAASISVEAQIESPHLEIDEYRDRLARCRRRLVRPRMEQIVARIDTSLAGLDAPASVTGTGEQAAQLNALFSELDRLLGKAERGDAWSSCRASLEQGTMNALVALRDEHWQAVRQRFAVGVFEDGDPLPVAVEDLGVLADARPAGGATVALKWDAIDDDEFERMVFQLFVDAPGYENPQLLMRTNAPDRGRDVSVERVREDPLGGTLRERVIVQCRHWRSRSIADTDISDVLARISHWEPPAIDELVVVTSGRFTADGVRWAETHNHHGKRPRIHLWPETHLERVLAQRPELVAVFKLR